MRVYRSEAEVARYEYRVAYRREGNRATQYKVFGLKTTTNKFLNKLLNPLEGLSPLADVYIERRQVGSWETWLSHDDLKRMMRRQ